VFAAGVLLAQTKQDDGGEQVFDLGDGITPPRLVHQVMPRHVKGSQGFRVGGVVVVGLVVTSKGLPKDVHVVKSLDKEVDQSAVDAVREWRFDPAKKDDKPVAVNVSVEIRFHDM
jgi:TonB family protein